MAWPCINVPTGCPPGAVSTLPAAKIRGPTSSPARSAALATIIRCGSSPVLTTDVTLLRR